MLQYPHSRLLTVPTLMMKFTHNANNKQAKFTMTIKSILTNVLVAIASILSIVGTFYIGIYLGDQFTDSGGDNNIEIPSSNDNTNGASQSPPSGPLPKPLDNKVCTDGTCKNKKVITTKRAADIDLNAQKPKVVRYVDKWTTNTVLAPSPTDTPAVPSGAQYCPFEEDVNEDYDIHGLWCFYDSPHTPATITVDNEDTNVSKDDIIPSANSGDFVSPVLQPGELTPIVWRESSKIVTQHAYQVGVPPELITSLLDYCKELGIIDLMQKYTTNEPIEPKEKGHNGKFLNLTRTNNVGYNDTYQWYAQRPEKKWKSNMHWISPANEKSHEDYLRALSRGNFDKVLQGIGKALKLDSLVAYHLTFIGVSHAERGFAHHDTTTTKGGVYNVIIPLLLEDDGEPELLLWDYDPPNDSRKGKRGGYKYKIGAAAMMGDDAIHGTHECDYRNMSNAKHGGWIEDEDSIDKRKKRRSGMRLAATVYIAEVYDENVETVAERTLTQIFPVCDEKWLFTQEARHWQNPSLDYYEVGNTMKNDTGRRAFRVDDEKSDCEERMEEGMCESDVQGTRKKCLFSCGVYIEEGVTRIEKKNDKKNNDEVDVCTQNRTGLEECRTYQDNIDLHGDFISPNLSPGELFPFVWRSDAKQVTPYAFQIGVPPELVSSLLDYCDRLGITETMREVVGDKPLEVDPDGERDDGSYNHYHEFLELKDGNVWFVQRPPSKWQSNMHWISPADEQTHEEYLKVLAAGNFDKVLKGIGEYLGLESLVAYQLTFIGVSHSEKGFIHRDTHHTGASVYNVIIPLMLEDDAEPELAMQDWDDESRMGTLKYNLGMAAMMGDDAMHGTQACDYREKKGMRLAATVYIADIHSHDAAEKIATQTLTQIFPMSDAKWLLAQSGRHWKSDDDETSLVNDKGREPFAFHDKLSDCTDRASKDMCASDQHTRKMCLKSCKIYQSSDSEDDDDDDNNVVHYEDYQHFYEVGQYINAFFDNIVEGEDCKDASDECEKKAKAGMCMSNPDQMDKLGCHQSCLYCLTSNSRELFSLGVDQVLIEDDDSDDDDSEDDYEDKEVEESDVLAVIAKTEQYFINEVLVKDDLRRYRLSCKNVNKNCAVWAAQGHCEVSSPESGFMYKDCPAACQECPLLDPALRCPIDESTNIFKPGDMNAMFERWLIEAGQDSSSFNEKTLTNRKFPHPFGDITVIRSPYHDATPYIEELEEEEDQDDNDKLPWLVSIDNFLTDEECERLIGLGGVMGYKRSTKYSDDETNPDGTAKFVTEDSRTSYNAWCYEGCDDDPIVRGVINRMEKMTGVPYSNYENLQLVRYTEGQQYKEHHDWTSTHEKHPYGGRILTIFLYLNDVEAGGGTKFNYLNFTATPKKGGAVVWPSMTDDMKEQNDWTWHQALPVEKGIKYGANAWLHIRNYQDVPDHC